MPGLDDAPGLGDFAFQDLLDPWVVTEERLVVEHHDAALEQDVELSADARGVGELLIMAIAEDTVEDIGEGVAAAAWDPNEQDRDFG